jgi:hypothetical protein
MRILNDSEARSWLAERGIQENAAKQLRFQAAKKTLELALAPPATREAVTALALNLVGVLSSGSPWLLWLKDFSIWSDDTEEIGWKIVDTFAQVVQQPVLNVNSSAMLFGADEEVVLKAVLLVPILFLWDAYLVHGGGNTFVRLDHDQHNAIATRDASVVEAILESQLKPAILNVKESP